jgi:hypothetical protein
MRQNVPCRNVVFMALYDYPTRTPIAHRRVRDTDDMDVK